MDRNDLPNRTRYYNRTPWLPIALAIFLAVGLLFGSGAYQLASGTPIITATKTDSLVVDNDTDGQADPGDTLEYTIQIQNTGDTNATNVEFNDTLDANTTLNGVAHVSPLAFADSYTSLGNVGITVNTANGVLANDVDPDNNVSLSVIPNAGGTAQGGAFAIGADGGFSYLPPVGFEGIDTFNYTLTDGDSVTPNDTETVTITVNEVIWFIDNSVAGPGTGHINNPFSTVQNFNNLAADEEGDIIFIYETGSGVYVGDTQLLNNQTVIGQGASSSIAAITGITVPPFSNTLPSTGGSRPTLGNSLFGVRIQANNTLVGFDIGNTNSGGGGIVIFPQFVNIGTITIDDMAIGGTGRAILFLGSGTLDITLDSVTSSGDSNGLVFFPSGGLFDGSFTVLGATNITNNQNVGINISNTSATYDFGDTTIALNTPGTIPVANAININNSPSGSFIFDSLAVTANRGAALFANNGGTVTVTGASNTASATLNPAVSLTNTTIGAGGITFQSVNSTDSANGIVLNNTGSNSFSVTGTGSTAGSGGTLQNISGNGVSLINTENVSLVNMNLTNTAQTPAVATGSATCDDQDSGTNTGCTAAVYMLDSISISLTGLTINDSNQHGLNGNNVTGLIVQNTTLTNIGDGSLENGLAFINLLGTVVFNNLDVSGSATRNALIENNTGSANITVNNGSSFNSTTPGALGEDGFHFVASGNATAILNIEESDFLENVATQLKVHAEEDSIVTVTIDNNDIDGIPGTVGNSGIDLAARDAAQLNYTVINNNIQPLRIHGINLFVFGGGSAVGRINGNTIDETNQGSAIRVVAEVTTASNPSIITEINDNVISNSGGGGVLGAVHIEARTGTNSGTANIQATVDGNSVALNSDPSDNAGAHYEIYNSDGHTVCANFTNNAASGTASFGDTFYIGNPVGGSGLSAGTVQLQGFNTNVQTTWTNNGNAGSTFNEGTNPVNGTCSAVAAIPSTNEFEFAQADETGPAVESLVALTTLVEPIAESSQPSAVSQQLSALGYQLPIQDDSFTIHNSNSHHNFSSKPAGLAKPLPAGETINQTIGTMEPGQSVTIIFEATVNDPLNPTSTTEVCNQGSITANGGISVLTDDPDDATGSTDQTCTAVEAPPIVCPAFPINVSSESELNTAIGCYNAITTAGTYNITLTDDIDLTASTTVIDNATPDVDLLIDGDSFSVDGQDISGVRPFEIATDTDVAMQNLTITGGNISGTGGGILNFGSLTLSNSTISGNSANDSGGGINNDGTLTVANSTFSGNSAVAFGGGISNDNDGPLTVTNSTFSSNSANYGGGISNESGTATVTNSTFSGNRAEWLGGGGGGGIYNSYPGTLTVTNSTFSGNSVDDSGGGIYNNFGTLTVTNSTFFNNSATNSGGGVYNRLGTAHLAGTILDKGTSGDNCVNISGTFTDNGYNLSDDATCTDGGIGSANNATLLLGVLADNGGPTQTHLPGAGSDAIGAIPNGTTISNNGTSWTCDDVDTFTDQRGESRPINSGDDCTAGAVEVATTFTSLTIIKEATPEDGADFVFTSDIPGGSSFTLDVDNDNTYTDTITLADIPAGSYTITETVTAGWSLDSATCTGGSDSGNLSGETLSVAIGAGEAVTCTFSNIVACPTFPLSVGTEAELNTAIGCYNAITTAGTYHITLTDNIDLTASTTVIDNATPDVDMLIDGDSFSVDGQDISGVRPFEIATDTDVAMQNLTITGGNISGTGGGILNIGSLTLSNSTVAANSASQQGAGIRNLGTLTLSSSTVSGNSAGFDGGGIFNNETMTLSNSTVSGNSSGMNGGGIFNIFTGIVTVRNSTIADNLADINGGGIFNYLGLMTLTNTIVADNPTGGNCSGDITNGGYNLDDGTSCGFGAANNSLSNATANLGPLQNNGGSTATHELLPGSEAMAAGDNATCAAAPVNGVDQRGVTRPLGATCDIGAFEAAALADLSITKFPSAGEVEAGETVTYTMVISNAGPDPAINTVMTDTLPVGVSLIETNGCTEDPNGVPNCTLGDIPANTLITVTVAVTVDSDTFGPVINTAQVGSDTTDPNTGNNSAITGFLATIPCPDFPAEVGNELELAIAVDCYNDLTAAGTYTINFTQNISLTGAVEYLSNSTAGVDLVIDGQGFTLDGQNSTDGSSMFTILSVGEVTMQNITLTRGKDTSSQGGGAIHNTQHLTLINSTIISNSTATNGGAIYNSGTATIINSTIANNSAAGTGGGIANGGGGFSGGGTLTILGSTLNGNEAVDGGGVTNPAGGIMTIANSTLSGNTGSSGGGAVYNTGSGSTATIINSTIAANTSDLAGGILADANATTNIANSIVADQLNGDDCAGTSPTTSNGHNLESGTSCGFTSSGDIQNGTANLGPLQINGGPTATHALLSGSDAIDAADNTICAAAPVDGVDQQGVTRPQGATCDIGAFEAEALADLMVLKTNDTAGQVDAYSTFTWTIAITNSGGTDATFGDGQVILQDDLPSNGDYGSPSVGSVTNVTNSANIACSITTNTLTCVANGDDVTLGASGSLAITLPTTPTNGPTLSNPAGGGICTVDPNGVISEGDEDNNTCADTVIVIGRSIIFAKVVEGGSATAGDFSLNIGDIPQLQGVPFGTYFLAPGSYTLTENGPAGYVATAEGDENVCSTEDNPDEIILNVSLGFDFNTCTIVNTASASGSLTIIKQATPEDGTDFAFTSDIPGGSSFTLDDEPTQTDAISQSITLADIPVGSYTITETVPADWQLDSATCTGGSDSGNLSGETLTVALGTGEDVTCTFTNTNTTLAAIYFQKEVPDGEGDPNNPNQTFTLNVTNFSDINAGNSNFTDGSGYLGRDDLPAGTYTVRELLIPEGWVLDDIFCFALEGSTSTIGTFTPGDTSLEIDLAAGDEVACTFTNSYAPRGNLHVTKVVDWNGVLPQNPTFEICLQGPTYPNGDETGACQEATGPTGATLTWDDIEVGDYIVTETDPGERWTAEISGSPVTVETDLTAQATITNTHAAPGSIYIRKVVPDGEGDPDNPGQTFSLGFVDFDAGRTVAGSFPAGTGFQGKGDLAPVTWTVREQNIPTNWTLDDIDCTSQNGTSVIEGFVAGQSSVDVELASNDRVDCTYINSFTPPTYDLRIIKYNDLDQDGTNNELNTGVGDAPSGNALTGWEFTVYDSQGNQVAQGTTSVENPGANGDLGIRVTLPDLTSGETYTICETQQEDWGNTQPGTIDPTYNEPCETVTLTSNTNVTRYFGNYQETGSLHVTKEVDWNGFPTDENQTFEICIQGSSYPDGDCKSADFDGQTLSWTGLNVGDYIVSETDPGDEWTVEISGSPATVEAGSTTQATVTNTHDAPTGSLKVTKKVEANGYPVPDDASFEICVNGPDGFEQCFDLAGGESETLTDLVLGSYTVSETNPGDLWNVSISGSPATVVGGQTTSVTVTNSHEDFSKLRLTSDCPPGVFRMWNPNSYPVPYSWSLSGTSVGGSGVAQPGQNREAINTGQGSGTVRLFVNGVQQDMETTLKNCVQVSKEVDWSGYKLDKDQSFNVCLVGPLPATDKICALPFGPEGGSQQWINLAEGIYQIEEKDPGPNWLVSGDTSLEVVNGLTKTIAGTVLNTYQPLQPDIDLEKLTNGQDADSAPGPSLGIGDPVEWTYRVKNSGELPLINIEVYDEELDEVVCTIARLEPGETEICTADGTAIAGQYRNEATATAEVDGPSNQSEVSDTDVSHYFGMNPTGWQYLCEDKTNGRVEVNGIGMGNRYGSVNPQQLSLADPDKVEWLLVQMTGRLHQTITGPLPNKVTFRNGAGQSEVVTVPNTFGSGLAYTYESLLAVGPKIEAEVDGIGTQYRTPRGLALYGLRTGDLDYWASIGRTTNGFVYIEQETSYEEVVAIPPLSETSDLIVTAVVADNNADARPLDLVVEAGGVNQTVRQNGPSNGAALSVIEVELANVPAGTSEVVIRLLSPAPDGDSGSLVGVNVSYICEDDHDGDTITNHAEGESDPDGDGVPNYLDEESDGDLISDEVEWNSDANGDGQIRALDRDADGDGTPNYLDEDSDNDGLPDKIEGLADENANGIYDFLEAPEPVVDDGDERKIYLPLILH